MRSSGQPSDALGDLLNARTENLFQTPLHVAAKVGNEKAAR